ncbi:bifunctional adenosylcobinamide kinase/adenosylcobinamide-phosphate guanylyltransferase [Clostridium sp. AM58-1XD]|uniref:bifunctional adenosylcobinamide kinase/adenosylcobinamide-phosphate guanylyltransferase n=1 Tax=Clostridium sp. AM58-1XD TaxID=2292307 RepID=UPI000E4BD195|nr:bifunctional adenosylcobinamide kinase/adenosylcobinamide-phosphate guanylyltransferase [Clostridium sp. AM58-1XD]RGZ00592.1 adenosylcobinamide kinase [Clostridium sp. AM58-1XD]
MKFVTGGAWQGKKRWVLSAMEGIQSFADGRDSSYEEAESRQAVLAFHEYILRMVQEGREEDEIIGFTAGIIEKNPDVVIIMDEIGYGIVPQDAQERRYREAAGRTGQFLAARAEEVYRVVAGIGQRIK